MEPKFQSSFIPKGPLASSGDSTLKRSKGEKERGLFYFLALIVFVISILAALGVFGYKFYLKYSIDQMGSDLDQARSTLQSEVINELTRLDNRIVSAEELISNHRILTPLFAFLETSTPKAVRFRDFRFALTDQGIELDMKGEALGYAALALQADLFSQSKYFKEPVFSDLSLNERGEVAFSFKAILDPELSSYTKEVERVGIPDVVVPIDSMQQEQATSTSEMNDSSASPN